MWIFKISIVELSLRNREQKTIFEDHLKKPGFYKQAKNLAFIFLLFNFI
jgi:hypothetical protein